MLSAVTVPKNFAFWVTIEYISFGVIIFGCDGSSFGFSVCRGAKIVIIDLGIEFKRFFGSFIILPLSSFFTKTSANVNIELSLAPNVPAVDVHFLPSHSFVSKSKFTLWVKDSVSVGLTTSKTFLAFIL